MISLLSQTVLMADKWIRCDALNIWFDAAKSIDSKEKQKGITTWYNAKKQIERGMEYWHFEFLDDETGELQEMNCRIDMHTFMLKENLYPNIILQCLTTQTKQ